MGMANGESDIYFGTDVGKWGAEGARKSPRREVVRSSAGADVVYPPFLGSFA